MKNSIYDKVVDALHQASMHNSSIMVKPEVILWPDPDRQWEVVIPVLQETFPALLIYGTYDQLKRQGPSIWLKCMVSRVLPEAGWAATETPIIYLPGISKNDLKNVQNAGLDFQPLMEYQYTGTVFTQENGKEWTILAFVQNPLSGLGIKTAQDNATKEALRKSLSAVFQDPDVLSGKAVIDAEYLNNQLMPDIIPTILKWMCKGDEAFAGMELSKRDIIYSLCKSQYDFEPDYTNIKAITEKLGSQRNSWKHVWQHYKNAPHKFQELQGLLRLAKPGDLLNGMFAYPEESWPQVNEEAEQALLRELTTISKLHAKEAVNKLSVLKTLHSKRVSWVWSELGLAPLANALSHLCEMAEIANEPFPFNTVDELKDYYTLKGFKVDQAMRMSLAELKTEKDKAAVKGVISTVYKPWLESITLKFQALIEKDTDIFTKQRAFQEDETYILFVDAFRYELAEQFSKRMQQYQYKVDLQTSWSAIPSLTPTAKPNVSPITSSISVSSEINEFRPQLNSGKDLQTAVFREALSVHNFRLVTNPGEIEAGVNYWQEIGDIDKKGHTEQAEIVKRVNELFDQVQEAVETAFQKGIKRVKIVTDHGWLLLPGGLPKETLNKNLTETRWGRCALIKEAAKTDLLHLPWRWNPAIFIAYAPGISFFKKNEEYAHGGISLHECLVPVLLIENADDKNIDAEILAVKWVNLKCSVNTTNVPDNYSIDIRTKYNDPKTSVILSKNKLLSDNMAVLMVDDNFEHQAANVVLLDETGRILDKKSTTIGG